jgi:FkbM family methyltransferase
LNLAAILKPEYLFRPSQILRRLALRKQSGFADVRLPWKKTIRVSRNDNVGGQVVALGVYDLVVTEALWRLIEPLDLAFDVGANVGYTALVMAERLHGGELRAFEPHPVVFAELVSNIESLKKQGTIAGIKLFQKALGPVQGQMALHVPADFTYHRGESSLTQPTHLSCSVETIQVTVETLDSQLECNQRIGMLKIDVEGFELEVLKGASQTFAEKRVRDCVFEEHQAYPSPVTAWLEERGYQIFRLDRKLSGPRLLPADSPMARTHWTATSFLATTEPARAEAKFASLGWRCLGR